MWIYTGQEFSLLPYALQFRGKKLKCDWPNEVNNWPACNLNELGCLRSHRVIEGIYQRFVALYSHPHICFVHTKDKISILGLRVLLSELMFVYSSYTLRDGSGPASFTQPDLLWQGAETDPCVWKSGVLQNVTFSEEGSMLKELWDFLGVSLRVTSDARAY